VVIGTVDTPDARGVEGRSGSAGMVNRSRHRGGRLARWNGFRQKKGQEFGTPQNGGGLLRTAQ